MTLRAWGTLTCAVLEPTNNQTTENVTKQRPQQTRYDPLPPPPRNLHYGLWSRHHTSVHALIPVSIYNMVRVQLCDTHDLTSQSAICFIQYLAPRLLFVCCCFYVFLGGCTCWAQLAAISRYAALAVGVDVRQGDYCGGGCCCCTHVRQNQFVVYYEYEYILQSFTIQSDVYVCTQDYLALRPLMIQVLVHNVCRGTRI